MNYSFFQVVDLANTDEKMIQIPSNVCSILIFAGCPNPGNNHQVYGGKTYVLLSAERSNNIVYEKEFFRPDGETATCGKLYASWGGDNLNLRSWNPTVRVRIYVM